MVARKESLAMPLAQLCVDQEATLAPESPKWKCVKTLRKRLVDLTEYQSAVPEGGMVVKTQ